MFAVNDKVVLVDDKWPDWVLSFPYYLELPVLDKVYVVREVVPARDGDARVMDLRKVAARAILLVGVNNPKSAVGHEHGFHERRFRKLDEVQEANVDRALVGAGKELVER